MPERPKCNSTDVAVFDFASISETWLDEGVLRGGNTRAAGRLLRMSRLIELKAQRVSQGASQRSAVHKRTCRCMRLSTVERPIGYSSFGIPAINRIRR